MKKINLALAALLALPLPAVALEFDPLLEATVGGEYSAFQGGPGSINYPGRALFIPLIKLSPKDALAPVLMVDAKYRDKPLPEDSEPFVSRWTFLARPSYKRAFSSRLNGTFFGLAKRTVTNDEFKRPWSKGLYDYEEMGGGAKLGGKKAAFGLAWSHKGYPNQRNPAPTGARNYYIKDLDITKLTLEFGAPGYAGMDFDFDYSLSFRNYSDSYVFKADGSLDDPRRNEQLHRLVGTLKGAAGGSLVWSAGLEAMLNYSNHNEFDFIQSKFKKNTQSFSLFAVSPGLEWLLKGDPKGHRVRLGGRFQAQAWADKLVRNSDGAYTTAVQSDIESSFDLRGTWAGLGLKGLDGYALADYSLARSNQAFEAPGFRYNYDLFTFQLGLEYRL